MTTITLSTFLARLRLLAPKRKIDENKFGKAAPHRPFFRPMATYQPAADFEAFGNALAQAQAERNPKPELLAPYYAKCQQDAHLASVLQQRRLATLGRPFVLLGPDGSPNSEAQVLLSQPWVAQLLGLVLDSAFAGYAVVELLGLHEQGFAAVQRIAPAAIDAAGGTLRLPNGERVPFREGELQPWCIELGLPTDTGLLAQATPLVMWKQRALSGWSTYLELFGMPFRKGHTDTNDPEMRLRMQEGLKNMGSSGWGVFDQEDRVEFVQTYSQGSGGNAYEHMVRLADEQLSKLILGQTMTSEAGGSLAQALVHERVAQSIARADAQRIEMVMNAEVLPRLALFGFAVDGLRFAFLPDEDGLSAQLKLELVKALLPYKRIPAEWLRAEFGIECADTEAVKDE